MCSTHAGAASGNVEAASREVLPKDVVPKHYRLFLEPDLKKYTYTGHVEIDVDVAKTTSKVSVNVNELTIHKSTLNGALAQSTSEDKETQVVTWEFEKPVEAETKATLRVEFDGELNDKLCGFYRSVHKDENGETQVVATTQMEATDCRRAFPCFDEPALKATFDISIAADKNLTVLSNSDVKSVEPVSGSDKQITHFNTTLRMSTYLVAFIVGDLRYVESKLFRVPVRVYATPGLEDRCQFAADLAARTLKFFEEKFDVEYPMPKCDMVGIHDFSAGAMENWGLITYRLVDIFYVEGKDSLFTKTRVAEVVQHELAHQWFGNLVTMEWWDGLWLNEGFATWMSWYSCNHFFPEWKVWETYVTDAYQSCLNLDGLRSSHPIQVAVNRADEVAQIFDAISYLKGSCVIRMVSQFVGEDTFIKGISLYLKRHKFGNTVTSDLWNAISEASGKDVAKFMNTWTQKVGYPLVSVSEQKPGSSKVQVTQNRYLKTGDVKPEEDETIYPVWLGVRRGDGSVDHSQVLTERSAEVDVGNGAFFKLNADQSGIFRVSYSDAEVEKLATEGLKGTKSLLSPEDRIGLVSDQLALVGKQASASQLLTLATRWRNDPEPNVASTVLGAIEFFKAKLRFENASLVEQYNNFLLKIAEPLARKNNVTAPIDDVRVAGLRAHLFGLTVTLGSDEFVDLALSQFAAKKFDVDGNLRSVIFKAVAKYGTSEQWEELMQHYLQGTNGASGNTALQSLGMSKDPKRKQEVLDKIIDGSFRTQDAFYALGGVASDAEGTLLAWKWLTANWDKLRELFPVSGSMIGNIVAIAARGFTKQSQLDDLEAFFADKDIKGIDRSLATSKDGIRATINLLDHDLQNIIDWLSQNESKL